MYFLEEAGFYLALCLIYLDLKKKQQQTTTKKKKPQ